MDSVFGNVFEYVLHCTKLCTHKVPTRFSLVDSLPLFSRVYQVESISTSLTSLTPLHQPRLPLLFTLSADSASPLLAGVGNKAAEATQ